MDYENSDEADRGERGRLFLSAEILYRLKAAINLFDTKREAADALGVSTDQLSRYLKGIASPPLTVLVRLAEAKEVRLDWIVTGVALDDEIKSPSTGVDEELYGIVMEAVSAAYRECGYTATLRQVAARAARIAAAISDGTPDQRAFALRASIEQLRAELRHALAHPTSDAATKSRA